LFAEKQHSGMFLEVDRRLGGLPPTAARVFIVPA